LVEDSLKSKIANQQIEKKRLKINNMFINNMKQEKVQDW